MDRTRRISSDEQKEAEEEEEDDGDDDDDEEDEDDGDDEKEEDDEKEDEEENEEEDGEEVGDDSTLPNAVVQRDVDGPEIKALRIGRNHCGDIGLRAEHRNIEGHREQAIICDTAAMSPGCGGRLRFFFAGRCVLELAHDTDVRGRPQQWIQTTTAGPSPRSTTWIPSTSSAAAGAVLQSGKLDKVQSSSSTSSLSSPEEAAKLAESVVSALDRRGSFLPFTIQRRLNRSLADRPTLQRAARRPFCLIHQSIVAEKSSVVSTPTINRRNWTFEQRTQRLDWLTHIMLERRLGLSVSTLHHVGQRSLEYPNVESAASFVARSRQELQCSIDLETEVKPTVAIAVSNASNTSEQKDLDGELCEKRDVNLPGSIRGRLRRRQRRQQRQQQQQQQQQQQEQQEQPRQAEDAESASIWSQNEGSGTRENVKLPPHSPLNPPLVPASQSRPSQRRGARGRTIGEAVRNFVIREILDLGGDPRTKYVPRGVFTEVGLRHTVDATTTYRWWIKYCNGLRAALDHADCLLPVRQSFNHVVHTASAAADDDALVPSEMSDRESIRVVSSALSVGDGRPAFVNRIKRRCNATISMMNPVVTSASSDDRHSRANISGNCGGAAGADSALHNAASSITAADRKNAYWPLLFPLPPPLSSSLPTFQQQHHRRRHHNRRHRFSNDATTASAVSVTSSDRCHPTSLPVGICLPYVWNVATTSSPVINKLHGRAVHSSLGYKTRTSSDDQVTDEPLDLTLPKKKLRSADDDDDESPSMSSFKPVVGERLHVST